MRVSRHYNRLRSSVETISDVQTGMVCREALFFSAVAIGLSIGPLCSPESKSARKRFDSGSWISALMFDMAVIGSSGGVSSFTFFAKLWLGLPSRPAEWSVIGRRGSAQQARFCTAALCVLIMEFRAASVSDLPHASRP